MNSRSKISIILSALLLMGGLFVSGCASTDAPDPSLTADAGDGYEATCEAALMKLERLIALRETQDGFPADVLFEARELQRMGRELYLERHYALALEMIEEGIQLVEE